MKERRKEMNQRIERNQLKGKRRKVTSRNSGKMSTKTEGW